MVSDAMSVKIDTQSIRTIAAFEEITQVHAKDCLITEECVYFLVDPDKVGLVIGKNGYTIKELRRVFGTTVKIMGYYERPDDFIKNTIPNAKIIEMSGERMTLSVPEEEKVMVIGKNGNNINALREIMERHFEVKSLKVK
jgi:N utilization substance protein A